MTCYIGHDRQMTDAELLDERKIVDRSTDCKRLNVKTIYRPFLLQRAGLDRIRLPPVEPEHTVIRIVLCSNNELLECK